MHDVYVHVHTYIYLYMCSTENTIVVCSQDSENVAVISKPLTTAMLHKILAGLHCSTLHVHFSYATCSYFISLW